MDADSARVTGAAVANLSLDVIGNFFSKMEPILHGVVTVSQILVALATVAYIIVKTLQYKKSKREFQGEVRKEVRRRHKKHEHEQVNDNY